MHFISNCSFFNNRSIALPGEHVQCFLEAVEHRKTVQLYLEDHYKKGMCFKNVLRMACDNQFLCRQLSEQKFSCKW